MILKKKVSLRWSHFKTDMSTFNRIYEYIYTYPYKKPLDKFRILDFDGDGKRPLNII